MSDVNLVEAMDHFRRGLTQMNVQLQEDQIEQFDRFLHLLIKWNKTYNLTAIRDPKDMVTHHFLDSLALLPYLENPSELNPILDVGSGGGFPGIPLAIARPDLQVTCLDANGKKTRFCQQSIYALHLPNVTVVNGRVEQYTATPNVKTVLARAFAQVNPLISLTSHLMIEGGQWILMKGPGAEKECHDLPPEVTLRAIEPLSVPGIAAERYLVILDKHV